MKVKIKGSSLILTMDITEILDLVLIRSRFGTEHIPTSTIPVTVDVKTDSWNSIFTWACKKVGIIRPVTDIDDIIKQEIRQRILETIITGEDSNE